MLLTRALMTRNRKEKPMVVNLLLLAFLGQLACATHSGSSVAKHISKKSFLEDALKEMDGIGDLTKPPMIPPRVIKVLVGPEHYHLGRLRHRHRHRHHHHHNFFNRIGHFSFPPRPTKPHVGKMKVNSQKQNEARKAIHDTKFMRQAVRLLLAIRKKLKSSGVKKAGGIHSKVNNTLKERTGIAPAGYSISILPKIRSMVQRDRDMTGQARVAFAKARQIIDKTHFSAQEAKLTIKERARNGTNITKETKISSAVAVLEDAVQKAAQMHTVNGTGLSNKTTAPTEPGSPARSLNDTNQKTLLSVLEVIKQNLTRKEDGLVGRVIANLRSLPNDTSSYAVNTGTPKKVLAGKSPKGIAELSTNTTIYSKSDNQKKFPNDSHNKTAVLEKYAETLKTLLQHQSVGSVQHGKILNGSFGKKAEHKNNSITTSSNQVKNNNNNNNNSMDLNNSVTSNQADKSITHGSAVKGSTINDNNIIINNNNNNSSSNGSSGSSSNSNATVDHVAKSSTSVYQYKSIASNHTNATSRDTGNAKVVTGEAKYLLSQGQGNRTVGPKLSKQKLASRKAFGLAMKLVKAALAREELRKAEQELFGKMKEMMNKTVPTAGATNSASMQPEKPAQDGSNPSGNTNGNGGNSATTRNAGASSGKNKKQDSENQEKYNEAAHLEEKIAAQQDKMYDDLVNHILDGDDRDDDDEGDEEGTVRELTSGPNEDYGDFKDSDEEMNQRVYGSKAGDSGRYTLRNVVLKPNASWPRENESKTSDSANTRNGKTRGSLKIRNKPHETVDSADDQKAHFHGNRPQSTGEKDSTHKKSKREKGRTNEEIKNCTKKGTVCGKNSKS